jgi:beta-lactamase regulating signal transducer with metallopeptidase domain
LQWIHPWSQFGPSELLTIASTEHVLGVSLLATWLLGAGVMLTRWMFRFFQWQHFIRTCPEVADVLVLQWQRLAKPELFCTKGRPVVFRISPEELGPLCYQFHQPIVFLPRSLIEGDATELRHVLHHELAHLQTQHPLQLFAQQVAQVVLWFHPLVWISGRRASLVREFVCDDTASEQGASTASYLRTLLHIVENRSQRQNCTLSLGRSSGELKLRARRMVSISAGSAAEWRILPTASLIVAVALASQVWLPTNPFTSPTTLYSAWPRWSAATLHTLNLSARDFEPFEGRLRWHELREEQAAAHGQDPS